MIAEEYKDIAPYDDSDFSQYMEELIASPGFENAISYVLPGADFGQLAQQLRKISNNVDFQEQVMIPILEQLERKTSDGITSSGLENISAGMPGLFMSNHRDIVLDASFLALAVHRHGFPTHQVALGDNLLIYDWIEHLVRLNKGIIVKRNLRMTKALEAARQLSGYIHYCISCKKESVWIAQREGRAKDSNDVTQESVLKMLALAGEADDVASRLIALNIIPVAISYEFDPNDYLKATEFLAKRRDPEFKKSQTDDLLSMETGLLKYKGRIHFHICPSITDGLKPLAGSTDKVSVFHTAGRLIDSAIHSGYRIYPVNYYAFDQVEGTDRFAGEYTELQARQYESYFNGQLDKVRLDNVTPEERGFMLDKMLNMYANPLRNQLQALNRE